MSEKYGIIRQGPDEFWGVRFPGTKDEMIVAREKTEKRCHRATVAIINQMIEHEQEQAAKGNIEEQDEH
jgi:hypothetical protein